MLVGRTAERLALDRLLADARVGRSGVLALVGEPGIGKTALLDYAAETATGMRVLRARGVESEAEVPFAGLSELLRPALDALDRIPAPQAVALTGALALGPPRAAQDRFAIGAATLSLLSAWADEDPLLLLVDDAHNLDGSSAGALLFAARRLVADPIALALTVREGERSLLDGADLRIVRVAGLDRTDAEALLEPANVTGDVVERLYTATGGNPLALLELAPEAGRLATWHAEGPVPISTSVSAAFARRAEELPEPTRRVLVLAAADDSGSVAVLTRAARAIGADVADLAPAEAAGLVTLDGDTIEFRHPLVRSALYADAAAQERRDAHAALAGALPDRDADRRAGTSPRRASDRTRARRQRSSRRASGLVTGAPTPSPPTRTRAGRCSHRTTTVADVSSSRPPTRHGSAATSTGLPRSSTTPSSSPPTAWSSPASARFAGTSRRSAARSATRRRFSVPPRKGSPTSTRSSRRTCSRTPCSARSSRATRRP